MKKSDLPWIIPLLTAFNEGKTIQFRHTSGKWVDIAYCIVPKFHGPGGAADYRIKPELKFPGQVYYEKRYGHIGGTHWRAELEQAQEKVNDAAIAVIRAYKNGELDLTGVDL